MELTEGVRLLIFGLAAITLVVSRFTNTSIFLGVAGFLLPLASLRIGLGVNLTWAQLLGPLAIALSVLTKKKPARAITLRAAAPFLAWAILVSLLWGIAEYSVLERYLDAEARGLGGAQAYYRIPVQTASYLMQFSAVAVVPISAQTRAEVNASLNGVILGVVVSIGAGMIGLALGLGGMITEGGQQVQVNVGATRAFRLGGLSQEPRHLGAFIVTVLPYVLARLGMSRGAGVRLMLLCTFLGALALTFSTSSWVALVFSALAYSGLALVQRRVLRLAVGLAIGAAGVLLYSQSTAAQRAVESRISDRLTESQLEGEKDYFLLTVYGEEPEYLPVGFGLGGFDLEATRYAEPVPIYKPIAFTVTPTSNIGRLVGEVGLIGIGLFIGMLAVWFRKIRAGIGDAQAVAFASSAAGLMLVSSVAFTAFLFVSGACLTLATIPRNDAISQHVAEE